jgi:flagellar M-ring protein FliF
LSYSHQPAGRIKRVTVAVLLDNVHAQDAAGKESTQPLSADQLADITRLVKSTVGFDEARGDSVNVVNAPFRISTEKLVPEKTPLWQQPWVMNALRLGLGAIVLLVIALGVLRPLLRNLATSMANAPVLAGTGPVTIDGVAEEGDAELSTGGAGGQPLSFEQKIVQARNLVTQDPKRVAQVVKTWVAEK